MVNKKMSYLLLISISLFMTNVSLADFLCEKRATLGDVSEFESPHFIYMTDIGGKIAQLDTDMKIQKSSLSTYELLTNSPCPTHQSLPKTTKFHVGKGGVYPYIYAATGTKEISICSAHNPGIEVTYSCKLAFGFDAEFVGFNIRGQGSRGRTKAFSTEDFDYRLLGRDFESFYGDPLRIRNEEGGWFDELYNSSSAINEFISTLDINKLPEHVSPQMASQILNNLVTDPNSQIAKSLIEDLLGYIDLIVVQGQTPYKIEYWGEPNQMIRTLNRALIHYTPASPWAQYLNIDFNAEQGIKVSKNLFSILDFMLSSNDRKYRGNLFNLLPLFKHYQINGTPILGQDLFAMRRSQLQTFYKCVGENIDDKMGSRERDQVTFGCIDKVFYVR